MREPKKQLPDDYPAIPCGLVAKSFFNDTFELYRKIPGGGEQKIDIINKNIAWSSDIQYKFANVKGIPSDRGESW